MIPPESPDELLVMAAILWNLEAFEHLVVRYRPAVVRLARSIVGAECAEDVAQDSLLLAFKALPSIEEPRKFAAWLSAITRHRALRFSKSETAHSITTASCARRRMPKRMTSRALVSDASPSEKARPPNSTGNQSPTWYCSWKICCEVVR